MPEKLASFSILDDDDAPSLSFADQSVAEGEVSSVEFVYPKRQPKMIVLVWTSRWVQPRPAILPRQ